MAPDNPEAHPDTSLIATDYKDNTTKVCYSDVSVEDPATEGKEDEEADLIIFPSCLVPQGRGVTSTHFRLLMMINKMMMAITH